MVHSCLNRKYSLHRNALKQSCHPVIIIIELGRRRDCCRCRNNVSNVASPLRESRVTEDYFLRQLSVLNVIISLWKDFLPGCVVFFPLPAWWFCSCVFFSFPTAHLNKSSLNKNRYGLLLYPYLVTVLRRDEEAGLERRRRGRVVGRWRGTSRSIRTPLWFRAPSFVPFYRFNVETWEL